MEKYFEGIGRRKRATARVRIMKGDKVSTVNGVAASDYFEGLSKTEVYAKRPMVVSNLTGEYYFTAKVSGGGVCGQVDAIRLGLSRAICEMDATLKPELRKEGLVTRDPREVERKKYDRRKARKKGQFSKR